MRSQPLLLLLFIPTLFGFSGFQPPTYTFSPALGDIQVINLEGNSGREVVYIEDAVTEVQICQLQAGETYVIQAVAMQDCQPLLDMPGSGKAPQSMFNFVADASCKTILVHADYLKKACTGAMYLSINCNSCFNEPASSYSNRAPMVAKSPRDSSMKSLERAFRRVDWRFSSVSGWMFSTGSRTPL
jgi:hypothetical protein